MSKPRRKKRPPSEFWPDASGVTEGALFRAINKVGRVWGNGMTPKVLWEVVRLQAKVALRGQRPDGD